MKKLLIPFIIVFIQSSHAGSEQIQIPRSLCSDTDIRDQNPNLNEFFSTPRDQDSIGWCYGFSAADLLSAELGQPVSAAHASILYNKEVEDSFFWRLAYKFQSGEFDQVHEGGYVKKSLKAMQSNSKVCLESDLPYDENYKKEFYFLIKELEDLKDLVKTSNETLRSKCALVSDFIRLNYNINLNANELYNALLNDNMNRILERIAQEKCADNQITVTENLEFESKTMPYPHRFSNESAQDSQNRFVRRLTKFFQKIDDKLKEGKPIGVDYNVKHVTGQKGLHASVLTERRWCNGRCEFKIRNSWGTGCGFYDYSKISDCGSDEGSFWVTDQKFYEMVDNITYID